MKREPGTSLCIKFNGPLRDIVKVAFNRKYLFPSMLLIAVSTFLMLARLSESRTFLTGRFKSTRNLTSHQNVFDKVVNGTTAKLGEFPFQASVQKNETGHFCGGSILSFKFVLTAAHCVTEVTEDQIFLIFGVVDFTEKGQYMPVANIILHEDYIEQLDFLYNDIAILETVQPIQFGLTVQPAKLPSVNTPGGSQVTITGWGALNNDSKYPRRLQKLENLIILDYLRCMFLSPFPIYPSEICVKGIIGRGACHGDSGGPLSKDGVIIGLTSRLLSNDGCSSGTPDAYTRVYYFVDWIKYQASASGEELTFSESVA